MYGTPVPHSRPWARYGLASFLALLVMYIVASGSSKKSQTIAPSSATLQELSDAQSQLSLQKETNKRQQELLANTNKELERLRQRLADLEAEHAKAHSAPGPDEEHNHEEMQTRNPKRDVLHAKLGRNELNKWSDMKLDRTAVRELSHVRDGHFCLAHSFPSFFNTSDSLCPLEIAKHMTKIPLNISLIRKEFDVFHYVPNCPSLLGRQICDLCQGYNRLAQLITERSKQEPLPSIEPTTRNPSDVHLAYVILVHRSDFLLATSVESLEKLIRRLYHPNDVIVLHIDRGSGGMFAEVTAAMLIAENFTSIVRDLVDPYCISPGGSLQVEAQLAGIKRLLEICPGFRHVVYLSGLDFPLRTRDELAAYLQPGMSYFTLQELDETARADAFEQYWRGWYIDCPNPTGNHIFRLATRSMLPGLLCAHSDNVYVLSRELATWLTTDEFARLLWLYFRTTLHAQEFYIPTAIATDKQFLQRVERKSLTLFEMDPATKSLALHQARSFKNNTEDMAIIRQAHRSGEFFFVHRPRPSLYKFIDSVRDPSFVNTDPPPAKGHEH